MGHLVPLFVGAAPSFPGLHFFFSGQPGVPGKRKRVKAQSVAFTACSAHLGALVVDYVVERLSAVASCLGAQVGLSCSRRCPECSCGCRRVPKLQLFALRFKKWVPSLRCSSWQHQLSPALRVVEGVPSRLPGCTCVFSLCLLVPLSCPPARSRCSKSGFPVCRAALLL